MTRKKLKILITAGPTREYIDPVRYLSNDSSGQMGFALAHAAKKLGHEVCLIAGPVALETSKGVKRVDVVSALEMKKEVLKYFKSSDVIIMAAAVADYRPRSFSKRKIKRTIEPTNHRTIELTENPDILALLGKKKKPAQLLIGFALETENLIRNAKKKLKEKNCDWIVANNANAIGAKNSQLTIIYKDGKTARLPFKSKKTLADSLFRSIIRSPCK